MRVFKPLKGHCSLYVRTLWSLVRSQGVAADMGRGSQLSQQLLAKVARHTTGFLDYTECREAAVFGTNLGVWQAGPAQLLQDSTLPSLSPPGLPPDHHPESL